MMKHSRQRLQNYEGLPGVKGGTCLQLPLSFLLSTGSRANERDSQI